MPISVILTDENGDEISGPDGMKELPFRLLPSADDSSFPYLRYIDLYGDTIFNQLQIEPFLVEWARLEAAATDQRDKELLAGIRELAQQCQREPHLYLKFLGD